MRTVLVAAVLAVVVSTAAAQAANGTDPEVQVEHKSAALEFFRYFAIVLLGALRLMPCYAPFSCQRLLICSLRSALWCNVFWSDTWCDGIGHEPVAGATRAC